MPRTKKGSKVFGKLREEYGATKGKQVYYGMIVKGKLKGAEGAGGTGKLAKAKRTYAKKHGGLKEAMRAHAGSKVYKNR